jgi:5-dehydro-2-deoxygluconokinase
LLCDAALETADSDIGLGRLGVIVDDRYGENVLARLSARQWWIGRPVEIPGSCPLEFDPRSSMGLPLQSWPAAHVVKCLVFYHPADPIALRLQQEERIRSLHADCLALGRELLLEIIVTANRQTCDDATVARVIRRFYNLGIFPAWWKLEPQTHTGWQQVSEAIDQYDPHCHGVLLLGLDAPEDQLQESFRIAVHHDICKGFAVGRSIFGDAARQWFDGQLDDAGVIRTVAGNYQNMIALWQEAASSREVRARSAKV